MTLLRRLALRISAFVVDHASPGCKDWAEGLASEAEHIQNDWSALAWSLGSIRVLLDRREAPLASLADVSAATWKLVDVKGTGAAAMLLYTVLLSVDYGLRFFIARSRPEQLGCGLIVLCSIPLAIFSLLERRRLDALVNSDINDDNDVRIYKAELEVNLNRPLWIMIISPIYLVGMRLTRPGSVHTHHIWGLYLLLAIGIFPLALLALHMRRTAQRRLDRLETLLAERSPN
jgi:hypothetical protein